MSNFSDWHTRLYGTKKDRFLNEWNRKKILEQRICTQKNLRVFCLVKNVTKLKKMNALIQSLLGILPRSTPPEKMIYKPLLSFLLVCCHWTLWNMVCDILLLWKNTTTISHHHNHLRHSHTITNRTKWLTSDGNAPTPKKLDLIIV